MPVIRPGQAEDLPFPREMLHEAAAISPAMRALPPDAALALPARRHYLEGWGRPGDAAVVAVDAAGRPIGAAWYRLFPTTRPGHGFVTPDVPELSIGVRADARGQGIGGALLAALLATARRQGHARLSLSVDRQNPARRPYERCGFRDAGISLATDSSVTLVASLSSTATDAAPRLGRQGRRAPCPRRLRVRGPGRPGRRLMNGAT